MQATSGRIRQRQALVVAIITMFKTAADTSLHLNPCQHTRLMHSLLHFLLRSFMRFFMGFSKAWPAIIVLTTIGTTPFAAHAQEATARTTPPVLERLVEDASDKAAAPPRTSAPASTTEKRAPGGRVTEIRVSNGGSTYYLRPQSPASTALSAGEGRTTQWNVLNFELPGSAKPERSVSDATAPAPVPPPPRAN